MVAVVSLFSSSSHLRFLNVAFMLHHYLQTIVCLVLQEYSTCVPTGCTSAEEWLAHVEMNSKIQKQKNVTWA